MEDPALPIQTDEQSKTGPEADVEPPKAGPGVDETPVDPIPESQGARQPTEESTAPSAGLGGDERLAPAADGSAAAPEATTGTARSWGADAGVTGVMPKSGAEKPAVLEEQTALSKASEGMVGHAIQPLSPQVVPLAMAEEDEVEEIERDEPQPQSV